MLQKGLNPEGAARANAIKAFDPGLDGARVDVTPEDK